jgi:hypothetical protein
MNVPIDQLSLTWKLIQNEPGAVAGGPPTCGYRVAGDVLNELPGAILAG